jgi:hypothetical protein
VAFVALRLNPDGEELRAQVAGLDLAEIQIAGARVLRQIEVLVDKTARRVRVGVDDDGRIVNGKGVCSCLRLRRRRRLCSLRKSN